MENENSLPPNATEIPPGNPPIEKPADANAPVPPTQEISAAELVTETPTPPPGPVIPATPAEAVGKIMQPPPAVRRGRGRPRGSRTRQFTPGGPQDTPERRAAIERGEIPATVEMPDGGQLPPPDFSDLAQPPPEPPPDYQMLASIAFDTSAASLSLLLGPEWQPQNDQERGAVIGALKRYFEVKQLKDIPPGYLLALVVVCYAGPRLQTPNTKAKLASFWFWSKDKIIRPVRSMFGRFFGGTRHANVATVATVTDKAA